MAPMDTEERSATDVSARNAVRPGITPVAFRRENMSTTPCVTTNAQGQTNVTHDPRAIRNRQSLDGARPLDGGFQLRQPRYLNFAVTALCRHCAEDRRLCVPA